MEALQQDRASTKHHSAALGGTENSANFCNQSPCSAGASRPSLHGMRWATSGALLGGAQGVRNREYDEPCKHMQQQHAKFQKLDLFLVPRPSSAPAVCGSQGRWLAPAAGHLLGRSPLSGGMVEICAQRNTMSHQKPLPKAIWGFRNVRHRHPHYMAPAKDFFHILVFGRFDRKRAVVTSFLLIRNFWGFLWI